MRPEVTLEGALEWIRIFREQPLERNPSVDDVWDKAKDCRARGETMMASYLEGLAIQLHTLGEKNKELLF